MVTSYVKIDMVHGEVGREIGTGELSTGSKTGITLFSCMTKPLVFQLILARIVAVAATFHRFGKKRSIVVSLVKSIVKYEIKDHMKAGGLPQLHDLLKTGLER